VSQLVLASASPRRSALLDQLGVRYVCDPADLDETRRPGETPGDFTRRMARGKAASVAARRTTAGCAILAADTVVEIDGDVLGKPADHFDALAMLARLSGRTHRVLTAVCLWEGGNLYDELVETRVEFVTLSRVVCEAYLATDEPWDKAGAYAIQGLAGAFVRSIEGSYSNVVGLPLAQTWALLTARGIATALGPAHE